jgi:hypothetical protein
VVGSSVGFHLEAGGAGMRCSDCASDVLQTNLGHDVPKPLTAPAKREGKEHR